MIQVYSFEEWDPLQPQENIIEWGHMKAVKSAEAGWNSSPYKDAPLEIRKCITRNMSCASPIQNDKS